MSIEPNDPRLTAYVLGELDEAERTQIAAAVDASPELQRVVDQTRHTVKLLSEHLQSEPCGHLTNDQRDELACASTDTGVEHPAAVVAGSQQPGTRRRKLATWSALAASLLVVCGATLYWNQLRAGRRDFALASTPPQAPPSPDSHTRQLSQDGAKVSEFLSTSQARTVASSGDGKTAAVPMSPRDDPFQDLGDVPIAYPDAEVWQELSARRRRLAERVTTEQLRAEDHYGRLVEGRRKATSNPMKPAALTRRERTQGASPPSRALASDSLIEIITATTKPETWKEVGGEGSVTPFETNLSLAITSDDRANKKLPKLGSATVARPDEGLGPGQSGDRYDAVVDNPFREVRNAPLSTFSIDVDTASYSKTRMYLMQHRAMPPASAVRIEELINYFNYDYAGPQDGQPFAAHVEVAECPWHAGHRLVRVGIKGKEIERQQRPASNLVVLLDVSGSMNQPNKLPLVKRGMKRLVDELSENDRVAIVVYAGAAGLVLPSTTGDQKSQLLGSLNQLHAGGSTNGGQGVRLAYQVALDNFIHGGTNRVILCTDGDFNVGTTSTSELTDLVSKSAKDGVFLSVLGFGMGNHNDAMLEKISNQGNGNYAFIDTDAEARKVLVEQMSGTLVTIAKDVKIQIEFNPVQVAAYRLIGYENRILAAEDFNDDTKDAGEIGAGHTVTALYEIVPSNTESDVDIPAVDQLKYQRNPRPTESAESEEMLTVKIRYKQPDGDTSSLSSFAVKDEGKSFGQATADFRFVSAVASFGMLLRDSPHQGDASYDGVLEIATAAASSGDEYRSEFLELVERAKELNR